MNLAERQRGFLAAISAEDGEREEIWPSEIGRGLPVHRANYRHALVEAIRSTYPRTAAWIGEESFRRAASHHVISRKPSGWTLDDVGARFPDTLGELFPVDRQVADLAQLEWALHRAFIAGDAQALDRSGFRAATAKFAAEDWPALRVRLGPAVSRSPVATDCASLWRGLAAEADRPPAPALLAGGSSVLVWREAWRPVFRIADPAESEAVEMALGGATYGAICGVLAASLGEEQAIVEAAACLSRWLDDGLICAIGVSPA